MNLLNRCHTHMTTYSAIVWLFGIIIWGAVLSAHPSDDGTHEQATIFDTACDPKPWTDTKLLNDPNNFQFVIVSDRTGGMREGIFQEAVRKINQLQPVFVMSVGDLIEGYYDNEEQINREWNDFNNIIGALEMKFFYVAGNHDTWSPYSIEIWEKFFGPRYYHFIYRDVLFLILHSEDGSRASVGEEQIQYLEKTLSENREVRWTFIFIHQPLWAYDDDDDRDTGWEKVDALIKNRKHTVFAGHLHEYTQYERNNYRYYQLATTGGGSQLGGPSHGQFDHIVWITMTETGPRLANLALNGIYDDDVRTEEMAEISLKMRQSFEVEIDPLYGSVMDQNASVETTLRIKNKAEIPMQVNGYFKAHANLQLDPYIINTELAPFTEKEIKIKIKFLKKIEILDALMLPMNINLSFSPEGFPGDLIFEETVLAAIDTMSIIPEANKAVSVDGDLKEWDRLPFTMNNPSQFNEDRDAWTGADDASLKFGFSQDKDFLYLAFDVRDDSLISKPGKNETTISQDHLGLMIDARPKTEREIKITSIRGLSNDILLFYVDPKPFEETISHHRGPLPDGVYFTGVKTEEGYAIEVAIPHSTLDAYYERKWESLRFNLVKFDVDQLTGSIVYLWWRPSWAEHRSYKNSGTFLRNHSDNEQPDDG